MTASPVMDGRASGEQVVVKAAVGRLHALARFLCGFALVLLTIVLHAGEALALKPISLTGDQDSIDITVLGEAHEGRGDTLQIEMAPGADGATARMAVRASTPGTSPNWVTFALTNPTNKAIELWLTADRYSPIGAGVVWPDLDARRIAAVTHSAGFAPERVRNDRTDIFRLTIERGQTITYVVELASERFTRINLWKPIEFEQRQRERQLFNGIMLGITGLLAVFLTAVFAANHKSIFPMAGLVAWCALGLLCVDFGFWHKLFQMKPEDNAQYRAAAEAALAASLVIFLAAFLRVNLWSGFARTLFVVWIVAQLAIVGVAVLDPRLAATVARLSLALIGGLGFLLILVLALRGLDRALAIMPTWILFLVWLFGAAVTLTGRMSGDFAISGLIAGLVLILLLLGFTVTQYAFRSAEPSMAIGPANQQMRLAALDRAGVAFWEWNVRRDEMRLDSEIEAGLGLGPGELPSAVEDLMGYVHPADRERFRLELLAIRERAGGSLHAAIRLRHADSSYRWLDFEGASVPTTDARNLRCVGLVRDITDQKRAHERLLHNAVYDSLTSLPNRELFLDRLGGVMRLAGRGTAPRPVAVFVVDVDRFRAVNSSFGLVVGDSIILTVSRRLARLIGPEGSLARIGGDQFALFLVDQTDPRDLATFAERMRLSLRSPIRIAGQEVVLTGSIGIAIHDPSVETPRDLMRNAEVAMQRAKRLGNDRVEIFSPETQSESAQRLQLEQDLAKAIDERRLTVLYQPIVNLSNDELIGFEAVVRWQHPKLGIVAPSELLPVGTRPDLVHRYGAFVLGRVVADIGKWQQELPRPEHPLFVTLTLSSRQLLSPELVQEVRHARSRSVLPAGALRLAIPETLVMDNPEQASHVLDLLREAGVELWMDRFGTGYSSLAYLGRFPFDAFKIDRALIECATRGERDAAIVRSIVSIGHELGRTVVGDGVGTAEDAAFLRSIGCHYAQGFHYGDPMAEDELVRLLRLIRKSERRMRRRGMVRGQEKKRGDVTEPAAAEVAQAPVPTAAAAPPQQPGPGSPPLPPRGAPPIAVRTHPASPIGNGGPAAVPTGPPVRTAPGGPSNGQGAPQVPGAFPPPQQQPMQPQPMPIAARSAPVASPPVSRPAPPQPTMRVSPTDQGPRPASAGSGPDLSTAPRQPASPASNGHVAMPPGNGPLPAAIPRTGPADTTTPTTRPTSPRQPVTSPRLSPAVAASLARLAGRAPPNQADAEGSRAADTASSAGAGGSKATG